MGLKRMLAACAAIMLSLCVLPGIAFAEADGLQVSSLGQMSRITTASASADDEEEPNDGFDTAQKINLNTMIYGETDTQLHAMTNYSAPDAYKITCPMNGTVQMTIWNERYDSNGRIGWSIYDSQYNEIESGDFRLDTTDPHTATCGAAVGKPLYFVIWGADGNGTGSGYQHPYRFKVTYKVGATGITSTIPGEKQFRVAWTKKVKASFYQVRYVKQSTYEDYGWSKASVKKVANGSGSCKVTGLAANSTYRVQVRVARTVDGETYYSSWSAAKQTKTVTKISRAKVTIASAGVYTGKAKKPNVTVTRNGSTLREGTHYTLSYANNVNAGKATVTVKGKGFYVGSVKRTFTIGRASLASAQVSGMSSRTYTGAAQTQSPVLKVGSRTLNAGADYRLSYSNNVNAGTATVTATGVGNYQGYVSRAFAIAKAGNAVSNVKGKKASVKRSKVKKKAVKVKASKAYRNLESANGEVTFKKVKSGSSKRLSVSKNSGKVKVKKGTKKGTYKVKVKVKATGDSNHNSGSKVVKVKIRVR